jgi:hypothetical protein
MRVKLLRELLVEPHHVQATPKNTIVEMDADRARDLAARDIPLVEIVTASKGGPPAEKEAAPHANKAAPDHSTKKK